MPFAESTSFWLLPQLARRIPPLQPDILAVPVRVPRVPVRASMSAFVPIPLS